VAHTHDDVGWLWVFLVLVEAGATHYRSPSRSCSKTVDQYYAGLKGTIQQACVKCILDSLIPALSTNPDRKFIYVEQAFFQRWWSEQGAATRAQTRAFVANGQLEMINGGWSMHDEANPDYVSMVDQTTLGHRFILEEFNATPRVTWQIDPFGHTATQASLLSSAWSGFQGLFFGRAGVCHLYVRQPNGWLWSWRALFFCRRWKRRSAAEYNFDGNGMDGLKKPGDFWCNFYRHQ
jgi:alpha-mannosidase